MRPEPKIFQVPADLGMLRLNYPYHRPSMVFQAVLKVKFLRQIKYPTVWENARQILRPIDRETINQIVQEIVAGTSSGTVTKDRDHPQEHVPQKLRHSLIETVVARHEI
jgi:hypothetical protein